MKEELAGMKRRLLLSFCFFIPLFYLTMGHMVGLPIPGFPFKIEVHGPFLYPGHITMPQTPTDLIDANQTIDHCGGGPQSDQGIPLPA